MMTENQKSEMLKKEEKLARITKAIDEKENSKTKEKIFKRNCYEVFPFQTGTCCGGGGDGFGGLIDGISCDSNSCSYTNKNK